MKNSVKVVASVVLAAWYVINVTVGFFGFLMMINLMFGAILAITGDVYKVDYGWEDVINYYTFTVVSSLMHYCAWAVVLKLSTGKSWKRCFTLPMIKMIKLPFILVEKVSNYL